MPHAARDFAGFDLPGSGTVEHRWADFRRRQVCERRSKTWCTRHTPLRVFLNRLAAMGLGRGKLSVAASTLGSELHVGDAGLIVLGHDDGDGPRADVKWSGSRWLGIAAAGPMSGAVRSGDHGREPRVFASCATGGRQRLQGDPYECATSVVLVGPVTFYRCRQYPWRRQSATLDYAHHSRGVFGRVPDRLVVGSCRTSE